MPAKPDQRKDDLEDWIFQRFPWLDVPHKIRWMEDEDQEEDHASKE